MTSGFVYGSAAEAEAAFKQDGSRYVYSRYRNPTVTMFEERLRLIEGAEACRATASGMAAVFAALLCKLRAGSGWWRAARCSARAITSSPSFCRARASRPCGRRPRPRGVGNGARAAARRLTFCESPSNPAMEIIDIAEVARLTHRAGGILVVDNVFATPLLQKPLALGADVVVYSATKHIDGQGRALGGAILRQREIHQGRSRAVLPPHRPVIVTVQRLAVAEGARDAGVACRAAMPHRRGDRALSRNPSEGDAGCLSRTAEPSAIRARQAAR